MNKLHDGPLARAETPLFAMAILSQEFLPWPLVPATNGLESIARKRVLVVDDEPAIRQLLCQIFADEGYLVSQAANGAEALQHLRLSQPDIVVLDLMMPVMNGLEFATECRHINGCADLPIILLSAMYEIVRKATWPPSVRISAYLGKPFDIQALLALVEVHARPALARPTIHPAAMWPPHDGAVRVLLVLDQPIVVQIAKLTLGHGTHDVQSVTTSLEAVAALATWQPHLVLLDIDLADATLMQHLGRRESGGAQLPAIGLTRRGDLKSKLAAFDAGLDDILTVPFAPEELLARVIALVRRSYGDAVTFTPVLKVGHLELDILKRSVRAGTSELHLTSLEQSLLYLLVANADRVVSHREILDTLWGTDSSAESNVVDLQVRNLRARLLQIWDQHKLIATVPGGGGYQFLPTSTSVA
jgi:DNA-binding response OmpR family regulator